MGYLVKTNLSWPFPLFPPVHFQPKEPELFTIEAEKKGSEKWSQKEGRLQTFCPQYTLTGPEKKLSFKMSFRVWLLQAPGILIYELSLFCDLKMFIIGKSSQKSRDIC